MGAPPVLYQPVENWGLTFGLQKEEPLPGEKKICSKAAVAAHSFFIDYERFSDTNRIIWVVATLKYIARSKTFRAGNAVQMTALHLKEAEDFMVTDVQKFFDCALKTSINKGGRRGHYAKKRPVLDVNVMWVVGERLTRYNEMTPDSSLQKLLPNQRPATRLFMQGAHQAGQRGRDAVLARFRMCYWEPHGSNVARSVKMNCQLCKLHDANFLEQQMGLPPVARLKPAPSFNHFMLDLFGPYMVRVEVQKRTSAKAYGVTVHRPGNEGRAHQGSV